MIHLKDKIKERKLQKRWYITIERQYIDRFGKPYTEIKQWDSYATQDIWEREKPIQLKMMRNCGYNIIDDNEK